MKKLKYFLAILALSLLAIPAAAQKGKDRDNKGGVNKADARSDLVKSTNKRHEKKGKKDNDKNDAKGRRKGFANGMHKGRH